MSEKAGAPTAPQALQVDIVSDVVCPWCVVGWKNFEAALANTGARATIRWRAYLLNPGTPPGGRNYREHLAAKYGRPPEVGDEMRVRLTALGAERGFAFNFTPETRTWNTERAHQLLHWAGEQGRQHDLKLAMFKAHFTENRAMDDMETLAAIAGETGLDAEEARAVLADERYAAAVREEAGRWGALGIQGVPAFIFNETKAAVGAQPVETFEALLSDLLGTAQS